MADSFFAVLMSVVIGTLAAIVIALRYVLIIERRMAKMELHLEKIVMKMAKEEDTILNEERKLEKELLGNKTSRKSSKSTKRQPQKQQKNPQRKQQRKRDKLFLFFLPEWNLINY